MHPSPIATHHGRTFPIFFARAQWHEQFAKDEDRILFGRLF